MKRETSKPLTTDQQAELAALEALTDEQIDQVEMPEARDWTGARRGVFSSSSSRSGWTLT